MFSRTHLAPHLPKADLPLCPWATWQDVVPTALICPRIRRDAHTVSRGQLRQVFEVIHQPVAVRLWYKENSRSRMLRAWRSAGRKGHLVARLVPCARTLALAWGLSPSGRSWQYPHFWEGGDSGPTASFVLLWCLYRPGPLGQSCPVPRAAFSQRPLWWSSKCPAGLRHGVVPLADYHSAGRTSGQE